MTWWLWVLVGIVGVLLVALLVRLWTLAVRIDRLHRRVVSARAGLGRLLVKRASDSLQIASSGILDAEPSQRINAAAQAALESSEEPVTDDELGMVTVGSMHQVTAPGGSGQRYLVESELSAVLRTDLDDSARQILRADPWGETLLERLDATNYRLTVTRTIHNQDVSQVRRLRANPLVRFFHLAGFAPLPSYVDFDDAI